jgi:hypothetical protein
VVGETPVTAGWTMSEAATDRGGAWAVHVSFTQKFPTKVFQRFVKRGADKMRFQSDPGAPVEHYFAFF